MSGRYSQYFDILCPQIPRRQVYKQIKIHNSPYLPELTHMGYFTCNNNKKRVSTTV